MAPRSGALLGSLILVAYLSTDPGSTSLSLLSFVLGPATRLGIMLCSSLPTTPAVSV